MKTRRLTGIGWLGWTIAACGLCGWAGENRAPVGERRWVRMTQDGAYKQRPAWSADGHKLLFSRYTGTNLALFEHDVDTGAERRVTASTETESDGVWSPDGREIAFTQNNPQPNQSDVDVVRLIVAEGKIVPVAATGKTLSHEEYPSWSPDGRSIAFTSTRDGNQELYTAPREGGDWTRLTSDPAHDAHPAWRPRHDEIAFATDRWGDLEIATIQADGRGLKRLTISPGLDDFPAWSPDGDALAFTSNRDGNREVYVLDVESGVVTRRTFQPGIDDAAAWTPDGRLTVVSQRDAGFDVYVEVPP